MDWIIFFASASYKQLCYTFRSRPKHTTVINYKHTFRTEQALVKTGTTVCCLAGLKQGKGVVCVYSLCFVGLTAGEMWMWLLGVLHKPGHSWLPHSRTLLPRGLPASAQLPPWPRHFQSTAIVGGADKSFRAGREMGRYNSHKELLNIGLCVISSVSAQVRKLLV